MKDVINFLNAEQLPSSALAGGCAVLNLQLNDREAAMLHKILESYLSDLCVEIARTGVNMPM